MALPLSVAALGIATAFAPPAVASADPPPGRAYEIVSPPDDLAGSTAGLSTDTFPMPGFSSDDGDAVIYGAGSSLGGNWSGPTNPMVFGWRTENGWQARTATRSRDHGDTPLELIVHEARSGWLTSDGDKFVLGVGKLLDASFPGPGLAAGIYETTSSPTVPSWLSAPQGDIPVAAGIDALNIEAGGDGNGTVLFQSAARLTPDAPPAGLSSRGIYVSRAGTLELVSRLPDGSVATDAPRLANGLNRTGASAPARGLRNQLAGGGRFALFVTAGSTFNSNRLYVRDLEQSVTRQLAGGGGGAPLDTGELRVGWGPTRGSDADIQTIPAGTIFAARDGARAFFRTVQDTGPGFLSDANLETGEVTARPALSGPPLALSRDGGRMLFLDPPSDGLDIGDWTLRYWDASDPDTSVALGTVPVPSTYPYGFAQGYEPSSDGRTWVFGAMGSLDPDRPNASPTIRQLYVWNVGDGTPTCLTCQPTDGVARTAGPNVSVQESVSSEGFMRPTETMSPSANASKMAIGQPSRAVSEDGRWVLFDSPDRLVGEDRNDIRDVYLWDRDGGPGGELHLVTRGTGATPSYAVSLDSTGRNAFFTTKDALVEADGNDAYDVYDARVDGGFPKAPEPSCGGDGCRQDSGAFAGTPVAGSITFAGLGNASAPAGASVRISKLKAVSGRVARLRVRVPAAGRVSVVGRAVRNTGRPARRAGAYKLRVVLKPRARRALAKRKRLQVAVRVVYRSTAGERASRTVRIVFIQPTRAGRKGGR